MSMSVSFEMSRSANQKAQIDHKVQIDHKAQVLLTNTQSKLNKAKKILTLQLSATIFRPITITTRTGAILESFERMEDQTSTISYRLTAISLFFVIAIYYALLIYSSVKYIFAFALLLIVFLFVYVTDQQCIHVVRK